ncbi:unnamed protein product [Effrenium voratum]|nr:unnamed protein product [Effrenium voratum]
MAHSAGLTRDAVDLKGSRFPRGPTPSNLPIPSMARFQLHKSGQCVPCLFHTRKEDGCWKGEACNHCHLCGREEAQRRRNRLHTLHRRQKRRDRMEKMKKDQITEADQEKQTESESRFKL